MDIPNNEWITGATAYFNDQKPFAPRFLSKQKRRHWYDGYYDAQRILMHGENQNEESLVITLKEILRLV